MAVRFRFSCIWLHRTANAKVAANSSMQTGYARSCDKLEFVCSGLYFCWFLLFTPDYGMRSGLGPDQVLAVFLKSDGSLPKFPFSGIGPGRNYEMKIQTAAETWIRDA